MTQFFKTFTQHYLHLWAHQSDYSTDEKQKKKHEQQKWRKMETNDGMNKKKAY